MTIRVFLADDHRLMVEGFRHALSGKHIKVVGVAYTLRDLAQVYAKSGADVLVIDVRFDDPALGDGLAVCGQILQKNQDAKIIVFSQFDDEWIIEKAYKTGVLAFVRKDEPNEVLIAAIDSAYQGKAYFSPVYAQLLAWTSVQPSNPRRLLDEKELQAFTLIADGHNLTSVAQAMNLSYKTITLLVKSIKLKLSLDNFADFTKLAIRYGLTSLDVKR